MLEPARFESRPRRASRTSRVRQAASFSIARQPRVVGGHRRAVRGHAREGFADGGGCRRIGAHRTQRRCEERDAVCRRDGAQERFDGLLHQPLVARPERPVVNDQESRTAGAAGAADVGAKRRWQWRPGWLHGVARAGRVDAIERRDGPLPAVHAELHFLRLEIEDRTSVAPDGQERHRHRIGSGRRLGSRAGRYAGHQQDDDRDRQEAADARGLIEHGAEDTQSVAAIGRLMTCSLSARAPAPPPPRGSRRRATGWRWLRRSRQRSSGRGRGGHRNSASCRRRSRSSPHPARPVTT